MGKLVRFDAGTRPAKPVADGQAEATALRPPGEVVLFTGVRYERDGTAPNNPAGSATGGKRRRG